MENRLVRLIKEMVASRMSLFVILLYALLPYMSREERWLSGRTEMSLLNTFEMVVKRVAL